MGKSEEITDIINQIKERYTPENFEKMNIKKGRTLTFDFEGSPVVMEVTKVAKGRYWAKHVELHNPKFVSSHARHDIDASREMEKRHGVPFCNDCELPVSEMSTAIGRARFNMRKETQLQDGTLIDKGLLDDDSEQ